MMLLFMMVRETESQPTTLRPRVCFLCLGKAHSTNQIQMLPNKENERRRKIKKWEKNLLMPIYNFCGSVAYAGRQVFFFFFPISYECGCFKMLKDSKYKLFLRMVKLALFGV
jgi:hypothetical protein